MDRGGDIKGNRLDVLFYNGNLETSHQKAIAWGVKYLECKFYGKVGVAGNECY